MSDLIERLRSPEFADVAEKYLMLEAADALQSEQWVSADGRNPDKTDSYLVQLVDDREGYDEEWFEVLRFEKRQAFPSHWWTSNFDRVVRWKEIKGPSHETR